MNVTASIMLAPLLPWPWLAGLAAVALTVVALALIRRARGAWWRLGAVAVLVLALFDPRLVTEQRQPLSDLVLVVVDDSASQRIGDRRAQTEKALGELRDKLGRQPNLDIRVERVGGDGEDGTRLFAAVDRALADVPRRRVAAVVMITDGRVHDLPTDGGASLGTPLHALITGHPGERDRRLVATRNPGYALVGKTASIGFRVDDPGYDGPVAVSLLVDGRPQPALSVPANHETQVEIPVTHAGTTVVELETEAGDGELSLANNRLAIGVSGVRDRLKVLLVSGEPHAGERTWRNLLKADPAVDLVHFTILRPPEKDDRTPIRELALITFPVRELFEERLNDFDLVVFDRYRRRGVLAGAYYQALAAYVKRGGALLVASGAEFAEPGGLYDTPLAPILPTEPTGRVLEQGFVPHLTDLGRRHPVTAALIGNGHWGEWLRQVAAVPRRDTVTLMSGADGLPLLVLGKVGEGRVAQLLSDTIWLWARGYDGGGPHDEVLRRLAHWLMKEPELEEDSLSAEIKGNRLEVVRRSLAPPPPAITVTDPDGTRTTLPLSPLPDGRASAAATVERPGLYRIDDGERVAIAAVGSLAPLEESELAATSATLTPVATASGGSVRFLAEDGVPDFRKVGESRTASGRGWAGLVGRGDSTVSGVRETPLLPSLALMALALGALAAAWTREGR